MKNETKGPATALFAVAIAAAGCAFLLSSPQSLAQDAFPRPPEPFAGKVDIDPHRSTPAWPSLPAAPRGAPNVVLILVDDVGFSVTSVFGGPVDTPNFAKLAAAGLRYSQFHVNALCSPTRATLLSGRNSHEVGFGSISEWGSGYPGYNTLWPKSAASIAEVLKDNGYSTAAFGKWHNTPAWQVSQAGPFDRWPTGLGFEYFYGFMGYADNQYYPRLYRDTTPVEPGKTPEQGYHFTIDITDDAIAWVRQHDAVAADRPFFIYYAPGATHHPVQVPKEWITRYQGKFDAGWDNLREETFKRQKALGVIPANAELTPRPNGLPAWSSLSADEKKLVAHQAEVYAGFAAQTDFEIGRLLQAIRAEGKADNTIVLEIFGDNGGSAQGGPLGTDAHDVNGAPKSVQERLAVADAVGSETYMSHFAAAWAWAFTTPFQGTTEDASHLGGVRDPMIVSWPARIKNVGGYRRQFAHVTDVAPTIYEAVGIKPPNTVDGIQQTPLEGSSLLYTFDQPDEPSHHHVQYFETSGNRGIYQDGWWAGDLFRPTWEAATGPDDINAHPWELYNLNEDYSQAHNLADKYPQKLAAMKRLFDAEAKRNGVYPILPPRSSYPSARSESQKLFVYREGVNRIPDPMAPSVIGHAYTISADVDIPAGGASGVIVAQGGRYGGFTLFVKDNRVVYEINAFGNRSGQVTASAALVAGKSHIVVNVTPQISGSTFGPAGGSGRARPGNATLTINGKTMGTGHFANLNGSGSETLDIGSDLGSPVSSDYRTPSPFTGKIDLVSIQIQ